MEYRHIEKWHGPIACSPRARFLKALITIFRWSLFKKTGKVVSFTDTEYVLRNSKFPAVI